MQTEPSSLDPFVFIKLDRPAMNLFIAYISILVTCPLLFTTIHFFSFYLHHSLKSKSPLMNTLPFIIISKLNTLSKSLLPSKKDEDEADESRRSLIITASDALVVMRRLGLWRGDKYCKDAGAVEGAYRLLEEKEASLEELEEAFAVFDEDGDGVISANELRNVLERLGFGEGIGLEECRGIICNYDLDGDGRIGFKEFRSLLEQAT